jgi:putative ABC transport system permease protein
MWTVTLADLRMRSRQFAIAVVGATLVFAMALLMAGLSGSFRAEAGRTVRATGADGFVVRAGGGGPFTSPADLDGRLLAQVRREPGVTRADALVVQPSQTLRLANGSVFTHVLGVRPGGLGSPAVRHGRPLQHSGDAVADSLTHLSVGEQFRVGSRLFTVVGTVRGLSYLAGTPSVYVTLGDAQDLMFGGRHDMTAIAILGTPSRVPSGLQVMTRSDARADILRPLRNGLTSIDIVRDFLWCVAVVIIGAVVYLSALERRRDFAVLKAIGSSTRWLYGGMAIQAGVVALVSGALAIVIEPILGRLIPMELAVPSSALSVLPPVALLIGLLASLSGLRQAVRADPALAFGSR